MTALISSQAEEAVRAADRGLGRHPRSGKIPPVLSALVGRCQSLCHCFSCAGVGLGGVGAAIFPDPSAAQASGKLKQSILPRHEKPSSLDGGSFFCALVKHAFPDWLMHLELIGSLIRGVRQNPVGLLLCSQKRAILMAHPSGHKCDFRCPVGNRPLAIRPIP